MQRSVYVSVFLLATAVSLASDELIWDDRPASSAVRGAPKVDTTWTSKYVEQSWERAWYPLGNGRLGCMVDGDVRNLKIQFNVDSLWTGDENISFVTSDKEAAANYKKMGEYQNFGWLEVTLKEMPGNAEATGYRRELDLSKAVYTDSFSFGPGKEVKRRIFVSAPDNAIFICVDAPFDGIEVKLAGAHGEAESKGGAARAAQFSGKLSNGLEYAARADVFQGKDGRSGVIVLRAATGTHSLAPAQDCVNTAGGGDGVERILARHIADYKSYYDRMTFGLGEGDKTVPTRVRLERVKNGAKDIALIALQFNFGRYLLISSSRPGTLPANLQGIWNRSNRPPWHCDYHTNINIQMNYWGADSANLSDCFTPFSDWMLKTMPVAEAGTRAAFPGSKGYAYRTSANHMGGGGWRWNFAGAPWMAAQCYDHWLFTRDLNYLRDVCWPIMRGAAEFVISTQLKERADGTVVVKNGWSPEHGPREDGVAHDQQIMRELFRCILAAAKTLGIDNAFTKEVARLEPKLLGDKIGSWGQLQEWETDRDKKGDQHRHTSHLYAVYPGSTISRKATPALAAAAKVALEGRALTGDARRSWTWPWRAALWARLGDGDKAGEMLNSLLRYNTHDNLFATHPPFQIDGNFGMVGAVCEILLERSIPSDWKHGTVKGLRTREGKTVDFTW
ncbi:MAG: glycoside hydrolase N-terminal domain-containing protein [Kiritimatiellae bacterium]|nr:glycoside hydrolase N-terminal domain-containing protein [Kiritimatiellia bacterium]